LIINASTSLDLHLGVNLPVKPKPFPKGQLQHTKPRVILEYRALNSNSAHGLKWLLKFRTVLKSLDKWSSTLRMFPGGVQHPSHHEKKRGREEGSHLTQSTFHTQFSAPVSPIHQTPIPADHIVLRSTTNLKRLVSLPPRLPPSGQKKMSPRSSRRLSNATVPFVHATRRYKANTRPVPRSLTTSR